MFVIVVCFFFSSRRRHTRFDCDWSSDVCSSDLARVGIHDPAEIEIAVTPQLTDGVDLDGGWPGDLESFADRAVAVRDETHDRRFCECRMRGVDVVLRRNPARALDVETELLVQLSLDVGTAVLHAPAQ